MKLLDYGFMGKRPSGGRQNAGKPIEAMSFCNCWNFARTVWRFAASRRTRTVANGRTGLVSGPPVAGRTTEPARPTGEKQDAQSSCGPQECGRRFVPLVTEHLSS